MLRDWTQAPVVASGPSLRGLFQALGAAYALGAPVNREALFAWDRTGLERLLRYCARPVFASERLRWIEQNHRLIYQLPKPRPDGQAVLLLTPLEFLDKLTGLMPPPRKHRHRYCLAS